MARCSVADQVRGERVVLIGRAGGGVGVCVLGRVWASKAT